MTAEPDEAAPSYTPVDISAHRNAGRAVLGSELLPVGKLLRDIPFSIGEVDKAHRVP
jgi:hypothetical protein